MRSRLKAGVFLLVCSSSCAAKVDDRQLEFVGTISRTQAQKVDDRQCVRLCAELLACQASAYNRLLNSQVCVAACLDLGPLEAAPFECLSYHGCMYRLCIEHYAEGDK